MYDEKTIEMGRAIFLFDLFLTVVGFLSAICIRKAALTSIHLNVYSHLYLIPLLLFLIIAFLSYFGAYASPKYKSASGYAWSVFRGVVLTITTLLVLVFFFNIDYVSRSVIIIFAGIEFLLIFLVRLFLRHYYVRSLKDGSKALHVLIIGTGERAKELSKKLRRSAEWGIKVIGHLDPDPSRFGQTIIDAPVIGTIDDISEVLKNNVIDEVIIGIPRSLLADAEPIAQACETEGIKLRFMADMFSLNAARIRLTQSGGLTLLSLEPVAQDEVSLLYKRAFDLLLTLAAIPLLLPVMGIIAISIKLDSPGPVFFIQERVGLKKRRFPMIKFRSMSVDAETRLSEIEHLNEAEGPIFKMKNDPRITRVGRFLRKTSLDELPQLFNVIRGEMSLIGPRPMSIRDVELFDHGIQRKRFSVKPGITCIWQISGRSDLPFEKWLELDLEYIENWSIWLDFIILFKTVPAVIFSKGAV